MSRRPPRPVSRLYRRRSVYQRIIEAACAVRYADEHRPLTYALALDVSGELEMLSFCLPKLDGPRSARVGARRAGLRAIRVGERLLREWGDT